MTSAVGMGQETTPVAPSRIGVQIAHWLWIGLAIAGVLWFALSPIAHARDATPRSRLVATTGLSNAERAEQTVHTAVRSRMGAVHRCYELTSRTHAYRGGRLTVELELAGTGAPSSVRIADDTIGDEGLTACVAGVFERLRTVPLPLEHLALSYPIVFARQ